MQAIDLPHPEPDARRRDQERAHQAGQIAPIHPRFGPHPSTRPRAWSSIFCVLGPPWPCPVCPAAVVSPRVAAFPSFSTPATSAMLTRAAGAAAMSSSGFVPFFPSNRVANVYGPLNELLPALKLPFPSLSLPSQTAIA